MFQDDCFGAKKVPTSAEAKNKAGLKSDSQMLIGPFFYIIFFRLQQHKRDSRIEFSGLVLHSDTT